MDVIFLRYCDESFVVNQTIQVPEEQDKGLVMFYVTLFIHSYWVIGSLLGSLLGSFITFDLSGLEFVLAALFLVIFLDEFLKGKRTPATVGIIISIICLMIFGKDYFLIPSFIIMLAVFFIFQRYFIKLAICHDPDSATDNDCTYDLHNVTDSLSAFCHLQIG